MYTLWKNTTLRVKIGAVLLAILVASNSVMLVVEFDAPLIKVIPAGIILELLFGLAFFGTVYSETQPELSQVLFEISEGG